MTTKKLQSVLYTVFLVCCVTGCSLGLLMIWGFGPSGETGEFLARLLATCVVVGVASALTMSATRLVAGRAPEDEDG